MDVRRCLWIALAACAALAFSALRLGFAAARTGEDRDRWKLLAVRRAHENAELRKAPRAPPPMPRAAEVPDAPAVSRPSRADREERRPAEEAQPGTPTPDPGADAPAGHAASDRLLREEMRTELVLRTRLAQTIPVGGPLPHELRQALGLTPQEARSADQALADEKVRFELALHDFARRNFPDIPPLDLHGKEPGELLRRLARREPLARELHALQQTAPEIRRRAFEGEADLTAALGEDSMLHALSRVLYRERLRTHAELRARLGDGATWESLRTTHLASGNFRFEDGVHLMLGRIGN